MRLWCAGSNAQGQLGTGDQEDCHEFRPALFEVNGLLQPMAPGEITQIACGANHTLVLANSRSQRSVSLWGAGAGSKGQLGIGSDVHKSTHHFKPLTVMKEIPSTDKITAAQASWETSFVVVRSSTHDRILSFGSNEFGLLGTGDTTSASVKDSLTAHEVCLDHLFSQPTIFLRITQLKASPRHVLAVLQYTVSEGEPQQEMLIGWGAARNGQLEIQSSSDGVSDPPRASGPRRVPLPIRIYRWISPLSVADMSIGYQHALVLLSDGSLIRLGSNSKSQLPLWGDQKQEPHTRVRCSWNNSFTTVGDSESLVLQSYGRNTHGQLGRSEDEPNKKVAFAPLFRIGDVVCGSEHCLVTGTNGESANVEIWAWGWNEHGNLGLGHTEDVQLPLRISMPDADTSTSEVKFKGIAGVWAGCGTSWIATEVVEEIL